MMNELFPLLLRTATRCSSYESVNDRIKHEQSQDAAERATLAAVYNFSVPEDEIEMKSVGIDKVKNVVRRKKPRLSRAPTTAYIQVQADTEHKAAMFCCGMCNRYLHCWATMLNLLFIFLLILLVSGSNCMTCQSVISNTTTTTSTVKPSLQQSSSFKTKTAGYVTNGLEMIGIPMPVFYTTMGLYFSNCLCNTTFRYLRSINWVADCFGYVGKIKLKGPIISYSCECYHMEERTVVTRNSDGSTTTTTEWVRVVTWSGSENWNFGRWIGKVF